MHSRTRRLAKFPWVAVTLALALGCGARAEGSGGPQRSAPESDVEVDVIDEAQLDSEHIGHRTRVTARQGAVPPGAEVALVNVATGVAVDVEASQDGTFEAVIVAEPSDAVRIDVKSDRGADSAVLDDIPGPVFECVRDEEQHPDEYVCDTLWREASCEWNLAVAAANGCSEDSDCIQLDVESRCFQCSPWVFVAKAHEATLSSAFDAIEQGTCSEILFGCGLGIPECDFERPAAPGCRDGLCGPIMGCEPSVYAAKRLIERTVWLTDGCTSDADCRVELLTPCAWGCPLPVVVAERALLQNFVGYLDRLCEQTPDAASCVTPMCEPLEPASAVCNAGTCVLKR